MNVNEEKGREGMCGLELMGPASHSQRLREGASPLSHTAFREDRVWNHHMGEASCREEEVERLLEVQVP